MVQRSTSLLLLNQSWQRSPSTDMRCNKERVCVCACVWGARRQMRERQRERVSHTHTQEPAKGQRLVLPAQDNNGHTRRHTNTHTHVLVILICRIRIDSSVLDLNYINHLSHVFKLCKMFIGNLSCCSLLHDEMQYWAFRQHFPQQRGHV